ncbi:MAG TPA: MotA/TolQ/ExbB proton channel family protein [Candidatus Hydrothermia bacterium]|nr:MotA/TolQ/ExbB proton channel family protein [Candidatus Hydrothermae bacterium]HOK23344.1 MotA/TolQ/ExbB proton channel family protein [Candidatus Hydrothermia bacterium]HOL24154.1 MotA/TolQ/ExbB proton channel family protein [Candidatus Hydrothermia bacterium]HOP31957.1 MotA/TolQ/ExbB proton channel family protein [Candidatus Hydrothermia bacterium]HPO79054.1 MotA/TolQ/ExbB proton channel family protein [Candidatus Hydrothermia bacterium]
MATLVDYFVRGGSMMWLLLILAILGLAFIIERLISLFIKLKGDPKQIMEDTIKKIEAQGIDAALSFLSKEKNPIAKVMEAGLEKVDRGRMVVEEAMTMKATTEFAFLDRGMIYLTAVTTLAPIVGFLGTVTGMIRAFNAIAAAGEVEPTIVASGISEALITTATGLLIAAPISLFYALFADRINNFTRAMEETSNAFIEYLLETGVIER